ncbi:MAG: hypothetical protein OEW12_01735 [Deltaproteobacteria bacterium]|nr:hypothetical protein [Deltaproteobacteria bacterium]
MKLFVDIDGVLLNFEHAFVRYLNRNHLLKLPEDYETDTFEFDKVLGPNKLEEAWGAFLAAEDAGMLKPYVDPSRFNQMTRPYTIHLLTNFPRAQMEKRIRNLTDHGFQYDTLDHCGFHVFEGQVPKSKGEMVKSLREGNEWALFVDDHPDNCLDVHRHCPDVDVWVMTRRFNQDFSHPRVRRAKDWECLFDHLGTTHPIRDSPPQKAARG